MISISKKYIHLALLALAAFFSCRTIFRYGFDALSNSFLCQLTTLFVALIFITVKPSKNFLTSYIPMSLLYLLIPALGMLCGHEVPAHEYLASFMVGNYFYFSILYMKLVLDKFLKPLKWRFYLYFCDILYLAAFIYALSFYVYFLANGGILQGDVILAIVQTNFKETVSYLETSFSKGLFVAFAITFIAVLFVGRFSVQSFNRINSNSSDQSDAQSSNHNRKSKLYQIVSSLFIVFFMVVMTQGIFIQTGKGYSCQTKQILAFSYYMIRSYGTFEKNRENIVRNIKFSEPVHYDTHDIGVFVLIIGESASRNHLSQYGYKHDTTPLLTKRIVQNKDNFNFLYFRNAYSSFTHTVQSVTNALTNINQYNKKELSQAVSIIDIAKKAGFDTYWLSNQSRDSMIVTPITTISMGADKVKFVSESLRDSKIYDLDILDIIPQNFSKKKNSLVIIHLMGSHTKYKDRYPEEFNRFLNEEEIINEYDNSIYYTDYVIDQLFNYFSQNTNLKFFGYFSDHGADPRRKGNDHNTTYFVFDMVRIPFVVGFSEEYLQKNVEIASNLSKHLDECFTNDLIFDLMMGIMGFTSSNYYESEYDLSSGKYSINKENARTLLGQKKISDDTGYYTNNKE